MAGLSVEMPAPGVALVVIDRPGRRNAFDRSMVRALPPLLEALAEDPDVRVVVLTGADGVFSAGGDLELVGELPKLPPAELEALLLESFQASAWLHGMAKPTIAAISGPAAGGGLGLALACDLRIAGRDATFVSTFIHLGIAPDYGTTWLLPRAVGRDVALEMALTGRRVDAEEARAIGLATRVSDDPLADALSLAGRIAAQPPHAVAVTKRLLQESAALDLAEALRAEAREQRVALSSDEFGALCAAWQAEISSVNSGRI
jgi:enoyl-CoA hydratase/carnithine racemase